MGEYVSKWKVNQHPGTTLGTSLKKLKASTDVQVPDRPYSWEFKGVDEFWSIGQSKPQQNIKVIDALCLTEEEEEKISENTN